MDHLSAAGSSATRNLTTTEPSESLNRRKTVDFRFQRPHATSRSFFFNKPMRAMDSRRDFTSKKVFSGYFSELGEKANSALLLEILLTSNKFLAIQTLYPAGDIHPNVTDMPKLAHTLQKIRILAQTSPPPTCLCYSPLVSWVYL